METQRRYYEVVENNEWEGETWHFFVPLLEEEVERLRQYVEDAGPTYRMGKEPTPEITVEVLLEREGATVYQAEFSRCAPLEIEIPAQFDPDDDKLYKGGLFKVSSIVESGVSKSARRSVVLQTQHAISQNINIKGPRD